jgi:uncharacterized membrane protein YfcA
MFPLDFTRAYIAYPLMVLTCAIANVAGLGAASVKIFVLMLVLNYNMQTSTVYTFPVMLGSAIINWAILLPKKHPTEQDKPLINFEFSLLFVPFMLVGANIGVLLNTILPMLVSSIVLILMQVIATYMNIQKGLDALHAEKKKAAEA